MSANSDRVSLPNTLALLEGDGEEGAQPNVLVDEVQHSPERMDAPNTARLLVSPRREVVVNISPSASWSSSSEGKMKRKTKKFPRAAMSKAWMFPNALVVPPIPHPPRGPSRRREVVVNISPRARWSSSSEGKMRGTRKFPRAVMSNVRRFPSALVVPTIPPPPRGPGRRAPRDVDNWVLLNGGPTIRRGPIVAPEQATRYNQPTRYNPRATRYNPRAMRYNPIIGRQITPSSWSSSSSLWSSSPSSPSSPRRRRRARQPVILPRRSSSSRSSRSSRSSGPSPRSSSSRP